MARVVPEATEVPEVLVVQVVMEVKADNARDPAGVSKEPDQAVMEVMADTVEVAEVHAEEYLSVSIPAISTVFRIMTGDRQTMLSQGVQGVKKDLVEYHLEIMEMTEW